MKKNSVFWKICWMLSFAVILFTGCKSEEEAEAPKAPEIPPVSTFMADLSFPTDMEGANNGRLKGEGEHAHWTFAATNVVIWQSVLTVHLAIPVIAFAESFNHDVEYLADEKKWRWAYSFDEGQHTYEAKLYTKLDGDNVRWEMYVSKSDAFENFLWYSGVSALDKTHGSWTVNAYPEHEPKALLLIEWHKEADDIADIKYTNIEEGGNDKGSYIHYGTIAEEDFNTFYDIYLKSQENLVEIDYNTTTKQGRVTSKKHFEDEVWHCWDSSLINIDC